MNRDRQRLTLSTLLAFVLTLSAANWAAANPVTYTIDPSLSSLNVEILFSGLPLPGQTAGITDPSVAPGATADDPVSKTTAVGGTLAADRTAGTLTFSGGNLIDALLNPNAEFVPPEGTAVTMDEVPVGAADGIYTPGEDNFGYQLDIGVAGHAYASIRDLALDITEGSAPLNGPATGLGFKTTDGFFNVISFSVLADSEEGSIVSDPGDPAVFPMAGVLTSSQSGTTETITLDVVLVDGDFTLTGTIVATGTVPEPSSLALLLPVGGILLPRRRK